MISDQQGKVEGVEFVSPPHIAFRWLLFLRWGAVGCQALLILAVTLFLDITIPVGIVTAILVFQGLTNLYFTILRGRRIINDWLLALVMFLDVTLLTLLLAYTGGPMNPFTFLYLVHIVLGAVLMRPKWSWALLGFTVFCYASFFISWEGLFSKQQVFQQEAKEEICHELAIYDAQHTMHMEMHLQGMWVAFSISAFFIVFFVGKIQKALEENQMAVTSLQEEKVRSEKLASLATLAAGAAHEFSTPLSTIAVAAGEMLYFLQHKDGPTELVSDAKLIREQVESCKEILFQMAADAGEHKGETEENLVLRSLLNEIIATFYDTYSVAVGLENEIGALSIAVPPRTFRRVITGLLKNGLDSCGDNPNLVLKCKKDDTSLSFIVKDNGAGMSSDQLNRAGEPFYTTKEPGKGLGLGLYLAKSFAERFGGEMRLLSTPGKGTIATLKLSLIKINAG